MVTCLVSRKSLPRQEAVALKAGGMTVGYVHPSVWEENFDGKEHTRLTFDLPEGYEKAEE